MFLSSCQAMLMSVWIQDFTKGLEFTFSTRVIIKKVIQVGQLYATKVQIHSPHPLVLECDVVKEPNTCASIGLLITPQMHPFSVV